MISTKDIRTHLSRHGGVLPAKGSIVARESYSGRSLIAKNSRSEDADGRGYLPVERWIMSTVASQSRLAHPGEGLTRISIRDEEFTLRELADAAEHELFGDHFSRWPLAKILDIGGDPVESSFGKTEVPPGAVEVHRGIVENGKATGPAKIEAYFYPPTDIAPYDSQISGALLRAGFKPGVTKENVKAALRNFGLDDSMFTLLNEYEVKPMTGWTIFPGVIHSAAAYITFEVQAPQDGYNAATWKFGKRLSEQEREEAFRAKALKGLPDEHAFVEELIEWELSHDAEFRSKFERIPRILDEGSWGKRYQVFFDCFYGEGWEIASQQTLIIPPKEMPQAGVVWSGKGSVNGNVLSLDGYNEFLVPPGTHLSITNTSSRTFVIYTVEPMRE